MVVSVVRTAVFFEQCQLRARVNFASYWAGGKELSESRCDDTMSGAEVVFKLSWGNHKMSIGDDVGKGTTLGRFAY